MKMIYFFFLFGLISLSGHAVEQRPHEYAVTVIGAPASGGLLEGVIGSVQKGSRHRFYCHAVDSKSGFLGPQSLAEPISLKNQPGVFPAPLMGPATLIFSFHCAHMDSTLTPVVVRPDGTIFYGLPLSATNSPQTLVVSSPAQTGIYTLFVIPNREEVESHKLQVEVIDSTFPRDSTTLELASFKPDGPHVALTSAEFIYFPHR